MRHTLSHFINDKRGNIAAIFALSAVPVMALLGSAVDYSNAVRSGNQIQSYLDSAVLKAINSANAGDAKTSIENYLANTDAAGATVSNVSISTTASVKTLTASASITVSSYILGSKLLGGSNTTTMTATSKASGNFKPISYTFTPTKVQGWYAKDIFIWAKDENNNVVSLTNAISYDYNFSTQKSTTSPAINKASSTFTLPSNYRTGLMMRVYYTGLSCGKTRSACSPPTDFYNDASNAVTYLKTTGACSDSAGQSNNWEDGGDANYQDFVYNLKCTLSSTDVENPRLVK